MYSFNNEKELYSVLGTVKPLCLIFNEDKLKDSFAVVDSFAIFGADQLIHFVISSWNYLINLNILIVRWGPLQQPTGFHWGTEQTYSNKENPHQRPVAGDLNTGDHNW